MMNRPYGVIIVDIMPDHVVCPVCQSSHIEDHGYTDMAPMHIRLGENPPESWTAKRFFCLSCLYVWDLRRIDE